MCVCVCVCNPKGVKAGPTMAMTGNGVHQQRQIKIICKMMINIAVDQIWYSNMIIVNIG